MPLTDQSSNIVWCVLLLISVVTVAVRFLYVNRKLPIRNLDFPETGLLIFYMRTGSPYLSCRQLITAKPHMRHTFALMYALGFYGHIDRNLELLVEEQEMDN